LQVHVPAKKPPRRRLRSLTVTDPFRAFVLDQLHELGDVAPRAMFGGVGLYCGGVFFGIIARDVLYLKVDESNRADYERAKMQPFKPYPDRSGTMQYYAVPVDVLESSHDVVEWARKAVAVAARPRPERARPSTLRQAQGRPERRRRTTRSGRA
jgi:DNA transformation protein and related proteins